MSELLAAARVTRALLVCGVIAGPLYVLVSVTEALTRDGFDLARHQWSLLSNGDLGWVHIANLVVTGLLTVAFAVGLRRVLRPGRGGTWVPRLLGVYGLSLVAAGVFRADPAMGFPPGTPEGAAEVTWRGVLHFVAGGIGFVCLVVACLLVARRMRPVLSRVTGEYYLLLLLAREGNLGRGRFELPHDGVEPQPRARICTAGALPAPGGPQ